MAGGVVRMGPRVVQTTWMQGAATRGDSMGMNAKYEQHVWSTSQIREITDPVPTPHDRVPTPHGVRSVEVHVN